MADAFWPSPNAHSLRPARETSLFGRVHVAIVLVPLELVAPNVLVAGEDGARQVVLGLSRRPLTQLVPSSPFRLHQPADAVLAHLVLARSVLVPEHLGHVLVERRAVGRDVEKLERRPPTGAGIVVEALCQVVGVEVRPGAV